jgi:flagella basal body P-ring formation protein FlgA
MKYLALTLAAFGALFIPLQVHGVVLELRDQLTMASPNLTLNDLITSSQGVTAEDLSAVIGVSPALGESQTWTRAQIEAILPSTLKQQALEWTGATACVINRPAVQYSPAEAQQLITAELGRQLPPNSDFSIIEMPNVDAFPVPEGQLDTRVDLTPGTMRNEWGEATLQFSVQGQLAVTKNIRFHWAYTRLVWQTTNRINNGDSLVASTFQQIEVNVLKIPGLLQPATDFPEGKVAAHPLAQGKILMENDWVEPLLVARNDLVTILYDHHGISITVQARAMSDGVRNEVIAVQNLTSHKIFNARVVDERSLVYDE